MFKGERIQQNQLWILLPLAGCFLFIGLYFLAAYYYPGGSQADASAKGFSWMHNYWCNLLNNKGMNGQPNAGRGFALAAMVVIAVIFIAIWIVAARVLIVSAIQKKIVMLAAILSMLPLIFLTTVYHDQMLMLTAFFGFINMGFIYAALYRAHWFGLFWLGIFNLVLIGFNNYIYYLADNLYWLPLVQKITFASYLLWIGFLSLALYRRSKGVASIL